MECLLLEVTAKVDIIKLNSFYLRFIDFSAIFPLFSLLSSNLSICPFRLWFSDYTTAPLHGLLPEHRG